MAKLTLEEKKLQALRMQLFGKEPKSPAKIKTPSPTVSQTENLAIPTPTHQPHPSTTSSTFLTTDLTKVAFLSSLAIGIQLILYYLSTKGIIHLSLLHLF